MAGSGGRAQRYVFGRAVFGAVGVRLVYNPPPRRASMDKYSFGRRNFLKKMSALSAAGVAGLSSRPAHAAYDPAAKFDLKVSEVEFRRNAAGRTLMARIYQPQDRKSVV